jgi:hypothetical protein
MQIAMLMAYPELCHECVTDIWKKIIHSSINVLLKKKRGGGARLIEIISKFKICCNIFVKQLKEFQQY